ncbi:MAG: NFACT family protein [Oscillospiraceae bacterium]
MPLDAICLRALLRELAPEITGARVEKVQQPARDQVVLLLRGGRRLYLNAGVSLPRIQLTGLQRENPAAPPMFCMLLRKHLSGGRIRSVTQPPMERLVRLEFDVTDELGQPGTRSLVLEAMGRRSNLILLDQDEIIIDCLRRVDLEMSLQRQVLPGMRYRLPPAGERLNPALAGKEALGASLAAENPEHTLSQWMLGAISGFSPLIAREVAFRAAGRDDVRIGELSAGERESALALIDSLANGEQDNSFTPTLLQRDGEPVDFTYLGPILQYGPEVESVRMESYSCLLDRFSEERERQERVRQKGQDLLRAATGARDRLARKLQNQRREYAQTQDRETYRKQGELITANLYRMERGQRELLAQDYYQEGAPEIAIPLDVRLTPQQNAARYYKLYNKLKTAEQYLRQLLEKGEEELAYLESVLQEISQAESEQDFNEIRAELTAGGYLRRQSGTKKQPKRPSPYREFLSSGGVPILVGRNNTQNDRLTLKDADKRDIWLHVQKLHGSHVILRTAGAEPDEQSLREAAMLAAWFSQGAESSGVAVDYAAVRYVKKPAGAMPGRVVYTNYRTLYVTPEKALAERLAVK